ncbi:hypothetical protein [Nocardia seriolae]|uniref:Uncharacterized protein n=1 Tax=Nocardia seriolae TaxID=37332 RepID=A0A0B8NH10_9NOCA|nr:hypothetical protein [Nocardia seriolae]APA97085.1 hypothetical protein NS506_03028 [Nocardia seriolae]MTJ65116.1 hypothetical protein [Nocardia seriolae]MTJ76518.1 hypothetical protein [Nocardia seriolae]MTJ86960.1 hypothetical protein [Nocardia seriolae]MTK30955.1 hypothetical protein [Nocardia seriolae]
MDPNTALTRIRALIEEHDDLAAEEDYDQNIAVRILFDLTEEFEDLDRWLRRGGFPPEDWAQRSQEVST